MAKVLIVEDDSDLVETYTDLLESKGYAITSASSAADAIQLALNTEPSVVILDLSLPGSSGIRVLEFIRAYKPLEKTGIIVVTGHSEMTSYELVEKADIVLTKPVSNEQLLTMIGRILRLSEATSLTNQTLLQTGNRGSD